MKITTGNIPSSNENLTRRRFNIIFASLLGLIVSGCGGGSEEEQPITPITPTTPITPITPTKPITPTTPTTPITPITNSVSWTNLENANCMPSATGKDYQVGIGKAYANTYDVPWQNVVAGDTVRIFYSAVPYTGKILISNTGTADKPIRICGVKSADGKLPMISGNNAVTNPALSNYYSYDPVVKLIHEYRTLILLRDDPITKISPKYIQIDNLDISQVHPKYSFTDTNRTIGKYDSFSACIWINQGENVRITNNVIHDCTHAIFTKSIEPDYNDKSRTAASVLTRDLSISGNYFYNNGYEGDVGTNVDFDRIHTLYLQAENVTAEFNYFGPMRANAGGNQIKDRSAGTTIRYNYVDGGAHAFDLVEAEDFPTYARALPSYRVSYVYGNIVNMSNAMRAVVHYGGDHFGSTIGASWGEDLFRKGTLYFYNNTIIGKDCSAEYRIFRVSTTQEKVTSFNNVFDLCGPNVFFRSPENGIGASWVKDGYVNSTNDAMYNGWQDSDIYHLITSPNTLAINNPIYFSTSPVQADYSINLSNSNITVNGLTKPTYAAVTTSSIDKLKAHSNNIGAK